jgi:RimJ/RimL family protein N-acetyltransferase
MKHPGILATTPEGAALCFRAFCRWRADAVVPALAVPSVPSDSVALRASLRGRLCRASAPATAVRPVDNGQMPILLETDRLVLRSFTGDDADHLYDLNSDPDVMWFLNGGEPTPREEVRDRIIPFFLSFYEQFDGLGFWAAETRATGDFLGWFHFRPTGDGSIDLGYRLRKAAWNKGYATEGSRALIDKGFTDLNVQRVVAHTMTVNQASRRVMEKCGLVFVRTYHSDDVPAIPGAAQGEVEYALTREDWQAAAARRRATSGLVQAADLSRRSEDDPRTASTRPPR